MYLRLFCLALLGVPLCAFPSLFLDVCDLECAERTCICLLSLCLCLKVCVCVLVHIYGSVWMRICLRVFLETCLCEPLISACDLLGLPSTNVSGSDCV